jgi:hypothetical protein
LPCLVTRAWLAAAIASTSAAVLSSVLTYRAHRQYERELVRRALADEDAPAPAVPRKDRWLLSQPQLVWSHAERHWQRATRKRRRLQERARKLLHQGLGGA